MKIKMEIISLHPNNIYLMSLSEEDKCSKILEMTANKLSVGLSDIKSKSRIHPLVLVRYIYYSLAWDHTKASLKSISGIINQTHPSAVRAKKELQHIKKMYSNSSEYKYYLAALNMLEYECQQLFGSSAEYRNGMTINYQGNE